ncbi:Rab-like protein 2A [Halocaridina rubra]|uniref:Rab-like protein 2A n=1 Tax=Halocaridina rubra TaxID=373956 RepID=A0AAN9A8M1_HALRR
MSEVEGNEDKDTQGESTKLDYDQESKKGELCVKVICLGDSAVGKSKLVERFLMDGYQHQQLSTYALTLHRYRTKLQDKDILVDFWDTAGQERFQTMHPSYYHQAHAAVLVFDGTRKVTYKNLPIWYKELRSHRPEIPCFCAVNKIDDQFGNLTCSSEPPQEREPLEWLHGDSDKYFFAFSAHLLSPVIRGVHV